MSVSIFYAILVTSLATFLSRFLGAVSSQGIKETSKLFKWFNCLAYATLAALIARTIIFPVGVLIDASYLSRITVVILSLIVFFVSKQNYVYPLKPSSIVITGIIVLAKTFGSSLQNNLTSLTRNLPLFEFRNIISDFSTSETLS